MKNFLIFVLLLVAGYFALLHFYPSQTEQFVEKGKDLYNEGKVLVQEIQDDLEEKSKLDLPQNDEKEYETETLTDIIFSVNTDEDSNIESVVRAPNGEGVVMFRENKVGIRTADGTTGIANVDAQGRPTLLEFNGYTVTFSNYTDVSVDMEILKPDGTTETLKGESILPAKTFADVIIPLASAAPNPYQDYRPREGISGSIDATPGTLLNVIGCGAGLASTVLSAGTTSPMAYLGCGALAVRISTLNTEIEGCDGQKGDLIDCVTKTILETVFADGLTLKGTLKNALTGTPIPYATIKFTNLRNGKVVQSVSTNENGDYEFEIKHAGLYGFESVAFGYVQQRYDAMLSPKGIRIGNRDMQEVVLEQNVDEKQDIQDLETVFHWELMPNGFIQGEVIDAETGVGIENATIQLVEDDISEPVADDGSFAFEPTVVEDRFARNVTLVSKAKGYSDVRTAYYLVYDYAEPHSMQYALYKDASKTLINADEKDFDVILKLQPILEENGEPEDQEKDMKQKKSVFDAGTWNVSFTVDEESVNMPDGMTLTCGYYQDMGATFKIKDGRMEKVSSPIFAYAQEDQYSFRGGIFDLEVQNFFMHGIIGQNTGSGTWKTTFKCARKPCAGQVLDVCTGTWKTEWVKDH